jgi:hypothetical protein
MTSRLLLAPAAALLLAAAAVAQPADTRPPPLKLPDGVTPESLADPKEATRVADLLEQQYPAPRPEGVRMLVAILRGSMMGAGDGWFGPAESRYGWAWLAARHRLAPDAKGLSKKAFAGPPALFDTLDRDGDGTVTPFDLDWSDRNPYVIQSAAFSRVVRRADASGDGRVSREEWEAFFNQVAAGKDGFSADDLRRAMMPRGALGLGPGDAPSVPQLVRGLFNGEVGSLSEGPKVGDPAPDFTLRPPDGGAPVTLSKLVGPKPVVLVLGNFTCGPFRALYPDVEAAHRRHQDRATFLMVYVREAHPADGWAMVSNEKVGVSVKQPATLAERAQVCDRFRAMVKPAVPVVVDDVADPVGTAYSGMPARLYVIDRAGRVAYKSGRGPFGFKPGELEQALAMCLLEDDQPTPR